MSVWKEILFTDYYEISSGLSKSASEFGHGYPFLSFKNVFENYFIPDELTQLVNSNEKERNNCSVKKGDIFLTRTSETKEELGMSCVALKDYENATFNGFTKRLRPKLSNEIDPVFIGFYLRSPKFRSDISAFANLITRASLNNDAIGRLKLHLPPINTQKRIGSILYSYSCLIENNLKRIKLLEEIAQRTYEEWFVKFRVNGEQLPINEKTGLPVGWERKNLPDFANILYGYPFKANDFNTQQKGTPIIRIRNIPISETSDFTTQIVDKKYLISKGDLLVGMDGEFHINNWYGAQAYLVQRSCKIEAKNKLFQGYLGQAIVAPVKFYEATISGATVAHLGKKHLDEILITVPTDDFKTELEKLNILLNQKVILSSQNRLLKESRDILLPKLMNGTIKVD